MHAYYLLFCITKTKEQMRMKMEDTDIKKALKNSRLVVISGLEPPTHGFSVRCSTN